MGSQFILLIADTRHFGSWFLLPCQWQGSSELSAGGGSHYNNKEQPVLNE